MVKDKIQIVLVTYNRIEYLRRTLNHIFDANSPIKDCDITILDNASTDGSSELIQEYANTYHNVKHIRRSINIGGNANIVRAFEYGAACGKEYVWVLCDDDKYDFSSWSQVEKEIENKTDIICVSNYLVPVDKFEKFSYQLFQLTFVPGALYRTELITDSVLICMYDAISTMFTQSCIPISAYNKNKTIKILPAEIVHNGQMYDDRCLDVSYNRGAEDFVLERKKYISWVIGYCNVLTLLNDMHLRKECLEVAISSPLITYGWSWFFHTQLAPLLFSVNKRSYFFEVFKNLKTKWQILFILSVVFSPIIVIYNEPNHIFFKFFGFIKLKIKK